MRKPRHRGAPRTSRAGAPSRVERDALLQARRVLYAEVFEMYGALVARRSRLATRMLIITGAVPTAADPFAVHMGPRYLSKTGKGR